MADFHLTTQPIPAWPDADTEDRTPSPFLNGYDDTLRLLNRELYHLNAIGTVVIEVVTKRGEMDLRRDGALRGDSRVTHPGVRLSFESVYGPLTYATDVYVGKTARQIDWQQNLRAIALGLESLRRVDRYGISKSGQQYRGWQAISARDDAGGGLSPEIALAILNDQSRASTDTPWVEMYRLARIRTHPDRNNGDRTLWDAVERAARSLGMQ